jgi:ABC-type nitrate/sulfonate/bicarbonate transport system substrate-binding protein
VLDVWYTRCPVPSAWGVALRSGGFHEEFGSDPGIAFRSVLDSEDPAVHDAHYYGTLENAFRLGGNIPPIWARSRGAETRVVGISWTTTPSPILALRASGIRDAAGLEGRRLLVIRRPEEEIDFLHAGQVRNYESALATAGLTLDDVTLVEKTVGGSTEHSTPASTGAPPRPRLSLQAQAIGALLLGEVDAVTAQGPAAVSLIQGFDTRVVYDISHHPDPLQRVHNSVPKLLTVDAGLIARRPEVVTRVLARLLEAAHFAEKNPAEAIHFIAQEQNVSEFLVEAAYGDRLAPELELNLSAENIARVEAQKEFLLRRGYIEHDFDVAAWLDPLPLEAARALRERNREVRPSASDRLSAAIGK